MQCMFTVLHFLTSCIYISHFCICFSFKVFHLTTCLHLATLFSPPITCTLTKTKVIKIKKKQMVWSLYEWNPVKSPMDCTTPFKQGNDNNSLTLSTYSTLALSEISQRSSRGGPFPLDWGRNAILDFSMVAL